MGTAQEPCDTKCKYVMSCEWLNNLKLEDRGITEELVACPFLVN